MWALAVLAIAGAPGWSVRRQTPGRLLRTLRRRDRPRRAAALRAQAREVFRDAILAAAERVFARSGLVGTRMADVAKEAGLATGTLYNYFANRDELLSSLVGQRSEELMTSLADAARSAASGALRDVLIALMRTTFHHLQTHRALFEALPTTAGISGRPMEGIGRQCADAQHKYQALVAGVLGRGVAAGSLRADVPLSILVGALTGVAHGVLRTWMAQPFPDQLLVDQATTVVDLFLRGASADS